MSWQDIPGWSDDIAGPLGFYEFIQSRIPIGGVFVEAGVFMGRSLAYMGERRPDLQLYAVDPWNPTLGKGERWDTLGAQVNYEALRDELGPRALCEQLLRTFSPITYARARFIQARYTGADHPPADLIFIDGQHDAQGYDDMNHAASMLKPGGIIAGHDYVALNRDGSRVEWERNPAYPDLVAAIDRWAAEHGKTVRTDAHPERKWSSCWWIQ